MTYQLHDYEIDSVVLENDSIIFSFPNGFYATDENGRELNPIRKKLVFTIDCSDTPLDSHIFIRRFRGSFTSWKEISFGQFSALFEEGPMVIYDEFDSKLTNRKMFQLNANTRRSAIELFIEDIADVACLE